MKKNTVPILLTAAVCCGVMALVDGVIRPGYLAKSAIKLVLFIGLPCLLSRFRREIDLKSMFRLGGAPLLRAAALGVGLYGLILGGFFLLRPYVDFSGIAGSLSENAGVTRENFLVVSIYISFVNSLLEEFFFRGFLFLHLKTQSRLLAYGCSAGLFSLYHAAMMLGWFPWWLFALALVGLALGGGIFNYLDEKSQTIYPSWMVHAFANFAINTIGFILL